MLLHLTLEEITFAYENAFGMANTPVLSEISLTFHTGETIGLVGASGSGKTTLLQLIAGLERPTRGRLQIHEEKQAGGQGRPGAGSRQLGMVFQFPEKQLFAETIFEDVAFGLKQLGLSPDEIRSRVQNSLTDMGLDYAKYAGRHFETLSEGEKRRVAIACILVLEPEMMILDEPTAGLDHAGRNTLIALLQAYHRRKKQGLLMASHDIEFLLEIVDRLWVLQAGRLVADVPVRDLFQKYDELQEILPVPRATRLARLLRQKGVKLPDTIMTQRALLEALDAQFPAAH